MSTRKMKKTNKKPKVSTEVKKYVEEAISNRVEDKYIQEDAIAITPVSSTTGSALLISHTPQTVQGLGSNNRIGDKIRLKDLDMFIHLAGMTSTHNTAFRVMMIKYKDPNGIALTAGDFMVNTAGIGLNRPVLAKPILDRVSIMYDKIFHLPCVGNVSADVNHKIVRIRKKNLNLVQTYIRNANTGTIADVEKNAVYLWIFGLPDSAGVSSRGQVLDVQFTLTYEDA